MKLKAIAIVLGILLLLGYAILPKENGGGGLLQTGATFANANYGVLGITKIAFENDSDRWLIQITQHDIGHILKGTTYAATLTPDLNGDKKSTISGSSAELVTSTGTTSQTAKIFLQPQSEACQYAIQSDPNQDKLVRYKVRYYPQYAFQATPSDTDMSYDGFMAMVATSPAMNAMAQNYLKNIDTITANCYSLGLSKNTKDYFIGLTRSCKTDGTGCIAWYTPFCVYPGELGRIGRADTSVIFKTAIGIQIGDQTPQQGLLTNSVYCPTDDPNCGQAVNIGNYGKAFWLWNGGTGRYCPGLQDQQQVPGYIPISEGGAYPLQSSLPQNGYAAEPTKVSGGWEDALQSQIALEANATSTGSITNIIDLMSMWHLYNNRLQNLKLGGLAMAEQKTQVQQDTYTLNCQYLGGAGLCKVDRIMKGANGNMFMMYGNGALDGVIRQEIQPTKLFVYNGNPTVQTKVTQNVTTIGTPFGGNNGLITLMVAPGTFIYPTFLVEINEAALPITQWYISPQECKPEVRIVSPTPVKIAGTMGTKIDLMVKNGVGGSNSCTMTASVLCGKGYSSSVPAQLGVFTTGQEKPISLDFSCQVAKQLSDQCNIKITGGRGEYTLVKLDTLCQPNYECVPNTLFCADGNHLVHCLADGTYGTTEYCDTCIPQGETAKCEHVISEVCNNTKDDNGNGLIDCQDPDCANSPNCAIPPQNANEWVVALIAGLLALMTFAGVYGKERGKKNQFAIAVIAAAVIGVVSYLLISTIFTTYNIQVANPLDTFTPHITDCGKATAGAWLPFDRWGCDLGNAGAWLAWLFGVVCAGAGAYFAHKFLSKVPEIARNKLLMLSMMLFVGAVIFVIAVSILPFVIIILVILALLAWFFQVPITMLGGVAKGLAGSAGSAVEQKVARKKPKTPAPPSA